MSAFEDKSIAEAALSTASAADATAAAAIPQTADVVLVGAPGGAYTNARRLVAGQNVSLDVSTPGQIAIGAVANALSGTYAARPAAGTSGREYLCTDSPVQRWYDTGSEWKPCLPQSVITAPTEITPAVVTALQAYTLLECGNTTGNTTITDYNGAAWIYSDTTAVSGLFARILYTVPPAATWKLRIAFQPYSPNAASGNMAVGIAFMDSATGKGQTFYTSPTVGFSGYSGTFAGGGSTINAALTFQYNGPFTSLYAAGVVWLEIEQTATQWIYRFSRDGSNWLAVMTMNRSGAFAPTPNRVGIYLNPDNTGAGMTLFSYSLVATP